MPRLEPAALGHQLEGFDWDMVDLPRIGDVTHCSLPSTARSKTLNRAVAFLSLKVLMMRDKLPGLN